MPEKLKYILIPLICLLAQAAFAQSTSNPNYPGGNNNPNNNGYPGRPNLRDTTTVKVLTADQQLDSLRKKLDKKKDTVIFNSKYIRVTNERFLKDSTQLFPLDTGLFGFENYNPLLQPRNPRIYLGNTGTDERALLYEPTRTIGFDVGLHTLDTYLLNPQDINYYRARVPYT